MADSSCRALAAELAHLHIDVFVVTVNRAAEAVQQTTTQIPIVMLVAEEPVTLGLVKSLARPGGNITGLTLVPGPEILMWFNKDGHFDKGATIATGGVR